MWETLGYVLLAVPLRPHHCECLLSRFDFYFGSQRVRANSDLHGGG